MGMTTQRKLRKVRWAAMAQWEDYRRTTNAGLRGQMRWSVSIGVGQLNVYQLKVFPAGLGMEVAPHFRQCHTNITKSRCQTENSHLKAVTFDEKCDAFMKVLFTKPPSSEEPTWINYQDSKKQTWPKINKNEIKIAIFTSFIKKAAGPDTISFLIIQKIYQVLKNRFYKLYKALIESEYHFKY